MERPCNLRYPSPQPLGYVGPTRQPRARSAQRQVALMFTHRYYALARETSKSPRVSRNISDEFNVERHRRIGRCAITGPYQFFARTVDRQCAETNGRG